MVRLPTCLGLGLLTSGQAQEAALNFTAAQALGGPLESKALEQLRQIHQSNSTGSTADFQRFLDELSAKARKHQEQLKASTSESTIDDEAMTRRTMPAVKAVAPVMRSSTTAGSRQAWHACFVRMSLPTSLEISVQRNRFMPAIGWRGRAPAWSHPRDRESLSICTDVERQRKTFLRNQDLQRDMGALSHRLHYWFQVAAGLCNAAAQRADSCLSRSVQRAAQALAELLADYRSRGLCARRCQDL